MIPATLLKEEDSGIDLGINIEHSLMLDRAANTYLELAPHATAATDLKRYTISFWYKPTALNNGSNFSPIIAGVESSVKHDYIFITANDQLSFFRRTTTGTIADQRTDAVFRDSASHYHFVIQVDSTQAVAADRLKYFSNNKFISSVVNNAIELNSGGWINWQNATQYVGFAPTAYTNALISELHVIDGSIVDPSEFGYENEFGLWVPKEYTGVYGNNGYRQRYNNPSNLGEDSSSNSYDFTLFNGTSNNQFSDTITTNYCTLNAADISQGIEPRNGGTYAYRGPGSGSHSIKCSMPMPPDKWYFESKLLLITGSGTAGAVGIVDHTVNTVARLDNIVESYAALFGGSNWFKYDGATGSNISDLAGVVQGSTVMNVAVDLINGNMWIGKDGVWSNSGDPTAGTNPTITGIDLTREYVPFVIPYNDNGNTVFLPEINFGQFPFAYSIPAGFKELNTTNLPNTTIVNGGEYFNTILYKGTGVAQDVTGFGFPPDLAWIKRRDASFSGGIIDQQRDIGDTLVPDSVSVETNNPTIYTGWLDDGFSVDTSNASVNFPNGDYVAWCWFMGLIPGFDIVKFVGDAVGGRTVAHSLGTVPDLFIVKNRDSANPWAVWCNALSGSEILQLDKPDAKTSNIVFWNNTLPDSSVITLGSSVTTNGNGNNLIAYLWSSIDGFSKIGQYIGNGSSDGPFIYCGFKPSFVLIKLIDGTSNWLMIDTSRNTVNEVDAGLFADLLNAESTANSYLDIVSNGFKLRNTSITINANGSKYLFMAFAEYPFKYARAR